MAGPGSSRRNEITRSGPATVGRLLSARRVNNQRDGGAHGGHNVDTANISARLARFEAAQSTSRARAREVLFPRAPRVEALPATAAAAARTAEREMSYANSATGEPKGECRAPEHCKSSARCHRVQ